MAKCTKKVGGLAISGNYCFFLKKIKTFEIKTAKVTNDQCQIPAALCTPWKIFDFVTCILIFFLVKKLTSRPKTSKHFWFSLSTPPCCVMHSHFQSLVSLPVVHARRLLGSRRKTFHACSCRRSARNWRSEPQQRDSVLLMRDRRCTSLGDHLSRRASGGQMHQRGAVSKLPLSPPSPSSSSISRCSLSAEYTCASLSPAGLENQNF